MIIGLSGNIGSGKDTVAYIIQALMQYPIRDKDIFGRFSETEFVMRYLNMKENRGDTKIGFNSDIEIKKFAGALKQVVATVIGCEVEDLENRKFKEAPLGKEWTCWQLVYRISRPNDVGITDKQIFLTESEAREWVESVGVEILHIGKRTMTPRLFLQLTGTEGFRNVIHPNVWVNALMVHYKTETRYIPGEQPKVDAYPNWVITDVRFPNEAKAIKGKGGEVFRIRRPGTTQGSHPSDTALNDWDFDWNIDNDGSYEDLIQNVKEVLERYGYIKPWNNE